MKITIKEVARMAGVHRSTVDKVLHDRPGVSDEVRTRIQQLIRDSGYIPNPAGRTLQRQNRQYHLAAVVVDVDALPLLRRGIEQAVASWDSFDIDIRYYITKFGDAQAQREQIRRARDAGADGIILTPVNTPLVGQAIDEAVRAGIPVVTTNSDVPESNRLCNVGQNEQRSSWIAGKLFGQMLGGRGKVGIVTNAINEQNNNYYTYQRQKTFLEYLSRKFPEIQVVEIVESFEDFSITYEKTLEMLARYPDLAGIYVTCGGVCEVGRALRETGRAQTTHVLCFEDYPEILELLREEVVDCTICSDIVKQGAMPVDLLMQYLVYDQKPEQRTWFTTTRILIRESICSDPYEKI